MKMTAILNGLPLKNKNFESSMIDQYDRLILKDGTIIEYFGDENNGPNDCFNYADWSSLEDTGFFEDNITAENLKIESCEYGFKINGYFVACYSVQNGYYTNVLTVTAKKDDKVISEVNLTCEER